MIFMNWQAENSITDVDSQTNQIFGTTVWIILNRIDDASYTVESKQILIKIFYY